MIKHSFLFGAALVLAALPVSAQVEHPSQFPDVVATVNGQPITKAELLTQGALMRSQLRKAEGRAPKPDLEFYRGVLDGLIGEALIFDDGSKRGVEATEQEVERVIQGMRESHGGDEAFQTSLVEQGSSLVQLRDQLHRSLSLEKVVRLEIGAESMVDEAEAKQFYEQNLQLMEVPPQVRVRHILAKADKNDPESVKQARARLAELRRKAAAGDNFEDLARDHSEDDLSRGEGGLLPAWVPITDSAADQRLYALKPGDFSEIEETRHGFHIIQMVEKRPSSTVPFEDAKDKITYMLETSRVRLGVQERIQKLKETAKIEIFI